jgi:hypothetical protein
LPAWSYSKGEFTIAIRQDGVACLGCQRVLVTGSDRNLAWPSRVSYQGSHCYADAASSVSPSRMKRVAPTERKKWSAGRSWSSASARRPVLASS